MRKCRLNFLFSFFWIFSSLLFSVILADETTVKPVKAIKILPDKCADSSSLKSIAESVTKGCKTNDEKAIAIHNYMQISHYHRNYPEGGSVLREINSFGWSLCGGLHAEQSALWKELGWKWRFVGWPGHTTVEAEYDGKWHYLDVFLKFYVWMPDATAPMGRTIASQDDMAKNTDLLKNTFVEKGGIYYLKDDPYEVVNGKANWTAQSFLVCGDDLPSCFEGAKKRNNAGQADGWMGQQHATGDYSADLNLVAGESLTNTWDGVPEGWYWPGSKAAPAHTCPNNKDLRGSSSAGLVLEPYFKHQRSYCNGSLVFAPDFSNASVLKSFYATENVKFENGTLVPIATGTPASVTVLLSSPYVMVKASGAAEGADSFEVTSENSYKVTDLKTFKAADMANFGDAVKGRVNALVKIGFKTSLKTLKLEAVVENNSGSLPYLSPGKNSVAVTVEDPNALGDNQLVVTIAYAPGYRSTSYDDLCSQGKRIAAQVDAVWAEAPTVVQKIYTAKDLPAKIEINVPTPKGKFAVYPKMIFVRRELISAKGKPMPLPENAQTYKVGPEDELQTLPNPFLIGLNFPAEVKK